MTELSLKETPPKGIGVFTLTEIEPGVVIKEFKGAGIIFGLENAIVKENSHNFLEIGPEIYLMPNGEIQWYVNHSCSPNCRIFIVDGRAYLQSLHKIAPATELTFDYSTTSTDTLDTWRMTCYCGSATCRGEVSGIATVPPPRRSEYLTENLIPYYIIVLCD